MFVVGFFSHHLYISQIQFKLTFICVAGADFVFNLTDVIFKHFVQLQTIMLIKIRNEIFDTIDENGRSMFLSGNFSPKPQDTVQYMPISNTRDCKIEKKKDWC